MNAVINAIGHSVSGGYDAELVDLRFVIDRDFVRGPRRLSFWREILRNQLWQITCRKPIPVVKEWWDTGHPFLTKIIRNGKPDLNDLFVNNCCFVSSHEHPEVRIADMTAAITSTGANARRRIRLCGAFFLVTGRSSR